MVNKSSKGDGLDCIANQIQHDLPESICISNEIVRYLPIDCVDRVQCLLVRLHRQRFQHAEYRGA